MGIAFFKQAFKNILDSHKNVRIVMLGLDGAGKTSILYKLKLNEIITTIPTVGFNVEAIQYKNITMTIWDVGGQDKLRKLWSYYYEATCALIFVVDSSDTERLIEAREEMWSVLNDSEMDGKPILIFANKQDMTNAVTDVYITEKFGMLNCKSHSWKVQPCCATNGEGLYEGLEWLSKECVKYEKSKKNSKY